MDRNISVEFAMYLMTRDVVKRTSADEEPIIYRPHEYDLLRGELIVNGQELFDEFTDYYNSNNLILDDEYLL